MATNSGLQVVRTGVAGDFSDEDCSEPWPISVSVVMVNLAVVVLSEQERTVWDH